MDPKETLHRVLDIDKEIKTLSETRDMLHADIASIRAVDYSAISVANSPGRGNVEDMAITLADMEGRICREIQKLWKAKREAEALIASLPDGVHRDIMRRRYLLCESWDDVAEWTHYTVRHVTRLHGEALETLRRQQENAEPVNMS